MSQLTKSSSVSRRQLFAAGTAAGMGVAFLGGQALAVTGESRAPTLDRHQGDEPLVTGTMPNWSIAVHEYQNPYQGTISTPKELDPTKRYIGAEIEVINDSDRPLAVIASQFRLRGNDSVNYPSGGFSGRGPRITDMNTLPGERQRGWVYFAVPDEVEILQMVYSPSDPQIFMDVPAASADASPVSEATPTSPTG
jgi:hypothetical protein